MRVLLNVFPVIFACTGVTGQVSPEGLKISVQTENEGIGKQPEVTGVKWLKNLAPDIDFGKLLGNGQFNVKSMVFERENSGPVKVTENDSNFIMGAGKSFVAYDKDSETLSFDAPTTINTPLSLTQGITSNSLPEWYLHSLNTFEEGGSSGGLWRPREISTCGESPDSFLGGHCKFADTKADGVYLRLPSHSEVKITARVHYFDIWEGQSIFMKVGSTIMWTGSWNWCPKKFSQECAKRGIDTCGHSYPDRLSVPLEITFQHSLPILNVSFDSTLPAGTDPCTVSWGVDDIAIYLR